MAPSSDREQNERNFIAEEGSGDDYDLANDSDADDSDLVMDEVPSMKSSYSSECDMIKY